MPSTATRVRAERARNRGVGVAAALLGLVLLLSGCSWLAPATAPAVSSTAADSRGGVPDGYPVTVDVVAPLVITALGTDPIPVTGTDGKIHVVYEIEILNAGPRAVTITSVDTLAGGADGAVVATIDQGQARSRAVLIADFGLSSFTDIPVGRTAVLLLDDVFATRSDVPPQLTHRITASLGAPPVPQLDSLAARFPDTVSQIGGVVQTSDQKPVVIGPPVAGPDWVATNGCCGLSSHRGVLMPLAGRLNAAERFAIDFLRVDVSSNPVVTFHGAGTQNSDYLAYDAPLLAVADGTVVSVVSDVPEGVPQQVPNDLTLEHLGGNYIILDIGGGNFAYYAHLIPGSASVRVGDTVVRGQTIGHLGDSGNSTEAHLHLHIGRAGVPLSSDNVPFVFDAFTFVGSLTGDIVSAGPDAGTRRDQLPLDGSVIDFPAGG